ncbi:putative RNA polymerase sigma factor FecI [Photorhabdus australis subsp. thailandensis]|uniref:Putative RNA polymerase sigma factor FecI n=2 Tax=Photorhabdus australis TaxID=286156 RepID=A0A1C0U119_9GAMM|nr:putative RNA polymerase sigma factor FecI [Photorhabdus australis subsp. thailandensis]
MATPQSPLSLPCRRSNPGHFPEHSVSLKRIKYPSATAFSDNRGRCLIANYYRRRKIEENYLEYVSSIPETTMPSIESKFAVFEQLEKLEITLDKLPSRVKKAFLLAQLQGLRYNEITDQLQVSSSSVKQYLQQAHNKCKKIQIFT